MFQAIRLLFPITHLPEHGEFVLFGLLQCLARRVGRVSQISDHASHANEVVIDLPVNGFPNQLAIALRISLRPRRECCLARFRGGFVHPVENPGLGIHPIRDAGHDRGEQFEGIVTLTAIWPACGRRRRRLCNGRHLPPLSHRVAAELAECSAGDQMALDVEEVVDGRMDGEEPLRGRGRFEPLHLSLSSSHRLM